MKRTLSWFWHVGYRPAVHRLVSRLAPIAGKSWFPSLAGVIAFAATLSMVVPTVPLLSAIVALNPGRWRAITAWAILGSATAGALLVHVLGHVSNLLIAQRMPELVASAHWQHIVDVTSQHGWWVLALVAASPLSQTPFLLLASVLGMSGLAVFLSLAVGKAAKYTLMAWITSVSVAEVSEFYEQHFRMHRAGS